MSPTVFVENNFFKVLDEYTDVVTKFETNVRSENRNQLINILDESTILSDIDDKEVIKLHKRTSSATFVPNDWRDITFWKAFRNYRFSKSDLNFDCSNRIYLLDADLARTNTIVESHNVLCAGLEYDFKKPVSPKSFSSFEVDKEMTGIERISHRSRNVIVIEPYLFAPIGSKEKNVPKIPNLIKLLKQLFIDNLAVECHLSLLYHYSKQSNSSIIEDRLKEISKELGNPNLKLSAFGHEDNLFQGNRHLITDYAIMDLQHPFDRDESSISVNFLYDGEIRDSFQRTNKLLVKAETAYKSCRDKIGSIQVKFGNILENELFK